LDISNIYQTIPRREGGNMLNLFRKFIWALLDRCPGCGAWNWRPQKATSHDMPGVCEKCSSWSANR
jgi:hypothetical protein